MGTMMLSAGGIRFVERHLRLVPQAWLSLQPGLQNLTPTDSFSHITHGFPLSVSSLWLSLCLPQGHHIPPGILGYGSIICFWYNYNS